MSGRAFRVEFSEPAAAQVRALLIWWQRERPAATGLLQFELDRACRRIACMPRLGKPCRRRRVHGVRRVLLQRSGYHVYYLVDEPNRSIEILSVWHARRGRGPSFVRERALLMAWRGGTRGEIRSRFLRVLHRRDALPM